MKLLLTLFLLLLFSPAVYAQEENEKNVDDIINEMIEEEPEEDPSVRFSPPPCDFEITFPEAPYTARRCPAGSSKCYEVTTYSMIYSNNTTVDFNVTCVPLSGRNYNRYDTRVLGSVLRGMVQRSQISDFEISTTEEEDYRRGSLVGETRDRGAPRIYNAQVWVGQNSVMTVEAKLIGRKNNEADRLYTEILRSIKKTEPPEEEKEKN